MDFIKQKIVTARKEYKCVAFEYASGDASDLPFSVLRTLVKFRNQGGTIKRGERHLAATFKDEGKLYTFRYNLEIDQICREYDFYQE